MPKFDRFLKPGRTRKLSREEKDRAQTEHQERIADLGGDEMTAAELALHAKLTMQRMEGGDG